MGTFDFYAVPGVPILAPKAIMQFHPTFYMVSQIHQVSPKKETNFPPPKCGDDDMFNKTLTTFGGLELGSKQV